ncbi:MAG: type II toxin-antitoxin system RelE/ParE family toxin [Bacillota bacterium]|nr:type II toxin-antitoxin system RelE/ParE family toxin [Bacillota bacterium]
MLTVEYYMEKDYCPVLEFIHSCSSKEQAKILREIDLLEEFGPLLGMPYVRKIEGTDDIWELRIRLANNQFRLLYFIFSNNKIVMLHGFQKKTQKTPKREIEMALKRRMKYLIKEDQQ